MSFNQHVLGISVGQTSEPVMSPTIEEMGAKLGEVMGASDFQSTFDQMIFNQMK
jgi:hypothetical protein